MALFLKQTTATSVGVGPMVDSSDGATPEASLTITQGAIRLFVGDNASAAPSTTAGATHDTMGWYRLHLSTSDTQTAGRLSVLVSTAGALPAWADFMVLPATVFDSFVSASDYLQVDLREANVAVTAGTVSDKAGYSLAAGQVVTAGTVSDKTGYSLAAGQIVTAGTVSDKSGYSLADGAITAAKVASGALTSDGIAANAILSQTVASVAGAVGSVTAAVTAGTVDDKAGYSLAAGQVVTAGTVSDKTGYSLAAGQVVTAGTVSDKTAYSITSVDSTSGNEIADYVLRRSLSSAETSANGDTVAFRSLLGAAAKLVNKISISSDALTIYQSNDTTSLGTQTLTSSSGAAPITAADTV
jgi:formylmethanofuran dehydrogenase subunit C